MSYRDTAGSTNKSRKTGGSTPAGQTKPGYRDSEGAVNRSRPSGTPLGKVDIPRGFKPGRNTAPVSKTNRGRSGEGPTPDPN